MRRQCSTRYLVRDCGCRSDAVPCGNLSAAAARCAGSVVAAHPAVEVLLFMAADAASAFFVYRISRAYAARHRTVRGAHLHLPRAAVLLPDARTLRFSAPTTQRCSRRPASFFRRGCQRKRLGLRAALSLESVRRCLLHRVRSGARALLRAWHLKLRRCRRCWSALETCAVLAGACTFLDPAAQHCADVCVSSAALAAALMRRTSLAALALVCATYMSLYPVILVRRCSPPDPHLCQC
jgi:hypothetical protein